MNLRLLEEFAVISIATSFLEITGFKWQGPAFPRSENQEHSRPSVQTNSLPALHSSWLSFHQQTPWAHSRIQSFPRFYRQVQILCETEFPASWYTVKVRPDDINTLSRDIIFRHICLCGGTRVVCSKRGKIQPVRASSQETVSNSRRTEISQPASHSSFVAI